MCGKWIAATLAWPAAGQVDVSDLEEDAGALLVKGACGLVEWILAAAGRREDDRC
jgi:hypothetical protein